MELEKQYTDVVYATKRCVAEEMGYHLFEPVWKQIQRYRSSYMMSIGDVEVCLCPGILKKMLQLNEFLFQLGSIQWNPFEPLLESETGKWMMNHLLKTDFSFESRLHQLCLLYQKDETRIRSVHQNTPYSLIFVLWIMMSYGSSEFGCLLVVLKLKCAGMTGLLNLMEPSDFNIDCQQDLTYALENLLCQWMKKGQQKSLFSCHDDVSDLLHQYPQLKKHQIEFYLNHHTPGYFYTIEQFIQYCDVCYETGRTALEQLVSLGFYQKIKLGKKFVYTAH